MAEDGSRLRERRFGVVEMRCRCMENLSRMLLVILPWRELNLGRPSIEIRSSGIKTGRGLSTIQLGLMKRK